MKIIKIKKDSRPYRLLKYLALGSGILIIAAFNPLGGANIIKAAITGYIKNKRLEKSRFLRDLKNLQKRELIELKELNDGRIKIALTQYGKKKMLLSQIDEMTLKAPRKWDKKWRLVMFDIPHTKRQARDALREKLKDLKFYPLQKSVFITPYPCEDEIDFIASTFNIRRHILILYVSNFEGEEKLKYHFRNLGSNFI